MILYNNSTSIFDNALQEFDPIGMGDIDCVRLMNRVETKYIVPSREINTLLESLCRNYHILESRKSRVFRYSTTYFDTNEYLFYNQHIRGQLSRYKIRYRKYEFTGESFLEIKKKTNKGRTLKWRTPNHFSENCFDEGAKLLLSEYSPVNAGFLKPVLLSRFSRITLVNTEFKERITIDYDISFSELNKADKAVMPFVAIVELKKDGHNQSGPFISTVRNMNIHPSGFSKYCIGNALLNGYLKKNILKPKILSLIKIKNEHIGFCSS
jgi:hypothetical protein